MDNILQILKEAMKEFYENEKCILEDNVSERCLVYNYSKYLEKKLSKIDSCDKGLKLDLEYNRNCRKLKSLNIQRITYPDLIFHKRRSNNQNILVIECKKWNNKSEKVLQKDRKKLESFKLEYGYKNAFLIIFDRKDITKVIYEEI